MSHSFKSAGLYKKRKLMGTPKFKKKLRGALSKAHSVMPN